MEDIQQQKLEITEEELREQIKPLPKNGFACFFVKLYRKWLEKWYPFADRHKKGAALIQKAFFFLVFSIGVTIWQYIIMTFLPYAFKSLNDGAWGWPNVPVPLAGDQPYMIFGDAQGLGYFIAFELAVFTAQCINFPLQRNLTYRSHGNPYIQALWYFIGWVLISVLTNALWGICNCFLIHWSVPDAVTGIGKTLITGIFSMVVFFFIFLIIFPDNVKLAKKARGKYEKALIKGTGQEKLTKLEEKALAYEKRARISEADKAYQKAVSEASSAALRYFALTSGKGEIQEEFEARRASALKTAAEAIGKKALAAQELEEAKK